MDVNPTTPDSAWRAAHLPHEAEGLVHLGPQGVEAGQQRVLEAPEELVDGARHEDLHANTLHPHGEQRADYEGVLVHLVHHRLHSDNTTLTD